jgi:ParB family chromosome partitioning protein
LLQVGTISEDEAERFATSFSEAARRALGVNRNAIARSMHIASIPEDLRTLISLHPVADNQAELLQLAAEPADRQRQIVELLTRLALPAANVAEAIAIMDRRPERPREMAWQKVSTALSRLNDRDLERVYELHEAGFLLWLQRKGAK